MKEKYITIVGFNHYYGVAPFKIGKKIKCVKEPSNPYDGEAIKATMKQIGTIGYVAKFHIRLQPERKAREESHIR